MKQINGSAKVTMKSKAKRERNENSKSMEHPKKKRKLTDGSQAQASDPVDVSAQFADELALLNSEEKLPNARVKEIYDSLTSRLLRLDGGAGSQSAAAAAARAVLTSQDGRQLWRVLSTSATAGQASAALRLLASCVTAGGGPARAVLAEFQFNHGRLPQVVAVKNLAADTDVRVEFVTFVLAFLVGADRLLIQAILDKMTPLVMVLSGLNTDRASTIHLVLSTFKQALLENNKIAKKNKLRLFNARNLAPLLQLYRWRGHQLTWRSRTNRYKKKKKKKQGADDDDEEEGANPADPEELLQVRENVHQFLTVLCTSHGDGIVFKDASLGTSGVLCNPVLLDLLRALSRPWRDQLTADLVVSTLSACPDLCQHYLVSLSGALSPPRASAEWRAAVAMVTAAVAAVQLTLPTGEDRLTPEAVCRAAAACYYPQPVTEVISAGISHEDVSVRSDSLQLLATVLDQVWALQTQLAESAEYGGAARAAVAADVTPHLPAASQLTAVCSQLTAAEPARPADLLLAARTLAGCRQVAADSWRLPAVQLQQLQRQLADLQLPEEQQQQLRQALRPLTDGGQSAAAPDRPLRPADVPRILAEIRGAASASETTDTTDSTETALKTAAETTVETTAETTTGTAGDTEPASEDLPTLGGDSPQQRLAAFVAMTTPLLRAAPPPLAALRSLAAQLTAALSDVTADVSGPAGWVEWVRQVLKRGLRQPPLGEAMLPVVTLLCERGLFPCRGGGAAQTEAEASSESVSCELLYEMVLSHSAFLERVLDPAEAELGLRAALLRLLLQVADRCQHVCKASHVALLLAAYGATMSDTDQTILLLISRYEMAGVSLQAYQPMVWGSAALNFYNPTQGGGNSLKSQPSADDVISLLDADKMAATCRRLPLKMALKPARLPADGSVYDVRFVLPLLVRLLAPEQRCEPLRLLAAGALGLALCLLCCRQPAVRAAGWTVLSRLYQQLLTSRHQRQRQVWLTMLDLVRAAVSAAPEQRLPFVVMHGWCRLVQLLQQPGHRLFRLVSRYLLKQAAAGRLDVAKVPLFFELFNSASSLEHRSEQAWMVGHLCQSVRQMSDYGVLQRTVTYKLVMGLAACCLATSRAQLIKVLEVTSRIPGALLDLHYRHGLLAWLAALLRRFCREPATRAALVSLAAQIAHTLREHVTAGGPRPAALLAGLETFSARLAEATRDDAALSTDVARLRRDVAHLQTAPA